MKHLLAVLLSWSLLPFALPYQVSAQATPDPLLVSEISKVKAIDNHAHPLRVLNEGEADTEWGSLSYGGGEPTGSEPAPAPFRLRPSSREYITAWQALYGYPHSDITKERFQELIDTKRRIMREQGNNYPRWVLDKLGVEAMLANRVTMGRGLDAPRFRWVSYADAFLFPLNNDAARRENPDLHAYYAGERRVLERYLADLHLSALPPTLDEYLAKVITSTLERQKRDGAVAVKFVAAYLRSLDFAEASQDQPSRVYARYVKEGNPQAHEYKTLQDYLFRYIAREAGRLGLAVHIHTGFGIGSYFDVKDSQPILLESVLNDPTLRKTQFVLIHGGWPVAAQTAALLLKPNVYVDFSSLVFLIYPRELSGVIRRWLEIAPEKVMFGTDAFELDHKIFMINWEEFGWIGANSAREALAIALTEMMNDGEITREHAVALARMVLRENASKLYKLPQ